MHAVGAMSHLPRMPRQDGRGGPGYATPPPPGPPDGGDPLRGGDHGGTPSREPAVTLPGAVVAMLVIIVLVHLARAQLTGRQDLSILLLFAFNPARYVDLYGVFPGGVAADVWTVFTYALLHGSWAHLLTNAIWLVAFGSAVARRFGALRFWLLSAAAAAGGAALHLAVHWSDFAPVVGASAAIAGLMAAAARFVFDIGGPMALRRVASDAAYRRPARSLTDTLANRTALAFIVVFFAVNVAVGVGGSAAGGSSVAWQAHLGGFLVGLLAFRLFDPVSR